MIGGGDANMIDHIVLLRWQPGASEAAREAAATALAALPSKVSGIVRYTAGAQSSPEGKSHGYDWGFVMTFTDAAARDTYLPHPEHQRVVAEMLAPIVADVLAFEFEHGDRLP